MTRRAKAAVKVGVEKIEYREFEIPAVPADGGILRIEACGVGGSDPELYRKPGHAPCIMGHEIVGTFDEVGPSAAMRWGVRPGDRVALHEYLPCWHCEWCLRGDFRLCMTADLFNLKDRLHTPRFGMCSSDIPPHLWGGYAEYLYVPGNAVIHRLPPDLPANFATLAIPFGNGVQWACRDGNAGPGKSVLVFGPGQQGLGCVLAAKMSGAGLVILAGLSRDHRRLELSAALGADIAIDVEQEDLKRRIMALTNGRGVDVVVDTTGDPTGQIAADAVSLAAKGATLNLNGLEQTVPIGEIKKRYLTVRAPRGHSYESIELALRYIASGKFPIDQVCSHNFSLDQVHTAIMATAGKDVAGAIHVTVLP